MERSNRVVSVGVVTASTIIAVILFLDVRED
jgi:hypothetical protein